jgi:hypothetical protein
VKSASGEWSLPEPIDDLLPAVLGFEDQFNHLADRAAAAGKSRREMGCAAHLIASVGNGERQTHAVEDRQIKKIIADKSDLVGLKLAVIENLANRRPLVGHSLANDFDAELGGTHFHDLRGASGDEPEAMARVLPKLDAESIANMELFDLGAVVVEDDDAVIEDAIHVGEQELNLAAAIGQR